MRQGITAGISGKGLRQGMAAKDRIMRCEGARDIINVYLDGVLGQPEAEELRAHIGGCAKCSAEVAFERAVRDACASLDGVELPEGFRASVMAAVGAEAAQATAAVGAEAAQATATTAAGETDILGDVVTPFRANKANRASKAKWLGAGWLGSGAFRSLRTAAAVAVVFSLGLIISIAIQRIQDRNRAPNDAMDGAVMVAEYAEYIEEGASAGDAAATADGHAATAAEADGIGQGITLMQATEAKNDSLMPGAEDALMSGGGHAVAEEAALGAGVADSADRAADGFGVYSEALAAATAAAAGGTAQQETEPPIGVGGDAGIGAEGGMASGAENGAGSVPLPEAPHMDAAERMEESPAGGMDWELGRAESADAPAPEREAAPAPLPSTTAQDAGLPTGEAAAEPGSPVAASGTAEHGGTAEHDGTAASGGQTSAASPTEADRQMPALSPSTAPSAAIDESNAGAGGVAYDAEQAADADNAVGETLAAQTEADAAKINGVAQTYGATVARVHAPGKQAAWDVTAAKADIDGLMAALAAAFRGRGAEISLRGDTQNTASDEAGTDADAGTGAGARAPTMTQTATVRVKIAYGG